MKFMIILLILFGIIDEIFTQETVIGPTVVKYRELGLSFYGHTKNDVPNNFYWMKVSVNEYRDILTSPVAIDQREFRIDEEITDYLSSEQMENVFKANLQLKVEFFSRNNQREQFVAVEKTLNLFPDSQENLNPTENSYMEFQHATITLSCYGYTGYNCQFKALDDPRLKTDFDSGETKCKDPKNCIEPDPECEAADKNFCQNNGTCYLDKELNKKYCRCPKGIGGEKCEIDFCIFDEDEVMFGEKQEFCDITACSREEDQCQNNGICEKHGPSFIRCKCDPTRFSGKFCEKRCDPDCIAGDEWCTYDPKDGLPFCYPLKTPKVINSKVNNDAQPLCVSSTNDKAIFFSFISVFLAVFGSSIILLSAFKRRNTFEEAISTINQENVALTTSQINESNEVD